MLPRMPVKSDKWRNEAGRSKRARAHRIIIHAAQDEGALTLRAPRVVPLAHSRHGRVGKGRHPIITTGSRRRRPAESSSRNERKRAIIPHRHPKPISDSAFPASPSPLPLAMWPLMRRECPKRLPVFGSLRAPPILSLSLSLISRARVPPHGLFRRSGFQGSIGRVIAPPLIKMHRRSSVECSQL